MSSGCAAQGVTDLVINLHLFPETVTGYFGDGRAFGVNIDYSYEAQLLGTAGALWGARRFLHGDRFWVLYADNLVDCDLERMERLHLAQGATLTMGLFWREDVSASGVVKLDADGRITGFKEKPAAHESAEPLGQCRLITSVSPGCIDSSPRGKPATSATTSCH